MPACEALGSPSPSGCNEATNVRHPPEPLDRRLDRLQTMIAEDRDRRFAIGDLVELISREHRLPVQEIAARLDVSRTRLSELRRTAVAFPPSGRDQGLDFHYYTVAARSAKKLGL